MVPLDDDADLALINNQEVVDKVMDAKTKGGDVGIRARQLLDRWALARGAELTRQEDAPAHISHTECDRCRRTYSNKATLVRHIRREHCDATAHLEVRRL